VDWIHLAQGREQRRAVVNTLMDTWVSRKARFLDLPIDIRLSKKDSAPGDRIRTKASLYFPL
jgi:hypothetical protein